MCAPITYIHMSVKLALHILLLLTHVHTHTHTHTRTLAEEDIAAAASGSGARPLAEAAGSECEEIYSPGKAEAAGFGGPKAALYVVSKAGYFPD
eukprot:scaffold23023_cov23-Tisochrysis_lutea.AAC.3